MVDRATIDRARDDLATFARLIGCPLADWQAASLQLQARTTYIVGPRQSGKSRSVAVLAVHRAFRDPGHRVLIVSASELGAKRLLATVADLVRSSPLLSGDVVDEHASLLRLSTGSEIRSVPASEKAIRGWSIDTLILDEAVELTDSIIDAALPTTAARPNARIVYTSTAGAPVGRAYETFMAGMGSGSLIRSFTWALRDADWITDEAVELARLTMPPWRFEAEYEGRWVGSIDALFSPDLLARASVDVQLPQLADLRGAARGLAGCDWAWTNDSTAVAAIYRLPTDGQALEPVFVVWPARVFAVGTEFRDCVREIVRSPAWWRSLAHETNGVGAGPAQDLRAARREHPWWAERVQRLNPVHTSWACKADALGRMRVLAERGQLVFQRDERFMRELASIRVEHRQRSVGIEAAAGGHDDLVDAAWIASCPYQRRSASGDRSGPWRNLLGELVRSEGPETGLPESARDGAVVETGDGLRVLRRPWLQSVHGPELTAPDGLDAAADRTDRLRSLLSAELAGSIR